MRACSLVDEGMDATQVGWRRSNLALTPSSRQSAEPLGSGAIAFEPPDHGVCHQSEKAGLQWVHLRMCLTCGAVGCCDSSRGRHARRHFEQLGHPAIRSIEPGEVWLWC